MKKRTRAFAIVTDSSRRALVRVAKVEIEEVFEVVKAALVEEPRLTGYVPHILGFDRLATKRCDIAAKLRTHLSRPVLKAENPPLEKMAGAVEAGPGAPEPHYWYENI